MVYWAVFRNFRYFISGCPSWESRVTRRPLAAKPVPVRFLGDRNEAHTLPLCESAFYPGIQGLQQNGRWFNLIATETTVGKQTLCPSRSSKSPSSRGKVQELRCKLAETEHARTRPKTARNAETSRRNVTRGTFEVSPHPNFAHTYCGTHLPQCLGVVTTRINITEDGCGSKTMSY